MHLSADIDRGYRVAWGTVAAGWGYNTGLLGVQEGVEHPATVCYTAQGHYVHAYRTLGLRVSVPSQAHRNVAAQAQAHTHRATALLRLKGV